MRTIVVALLGALILMPGFAHAAPPADVGTGRVAWFDISSNNLPKSKEFYAKLFGWGFVPVKGTDQAVEIVSRTQHIGTLRGASGAVSPFNGVVYIQVLDMPASVTKAKALGGKLVEGFPFDLPDASGSIALIVDPAGHPIGMYSKKSLPLPGPPAPNQ